MHVHRDPKRLNSFLGGPLVVLAIDAVRAHGPETIRIAAKHYFGPRHPLTIAAGSVVAGDLTPEEFLSGLIVLELKCAEGFMRTIDGVGAAHAEARRA